MALIFEIVAIAITVAVGIATYFKWAFSYWKKKRLPYVEPKFPFGNSENPFTRKYYIGIRIKKFYQELKSQGHKHGGLYFFTRPTYMPIDPEYLKNIMSRDFRYFMDRGMYYNEQIDPLSAHLFNLEGQRWRNLRAKLTPTFSSGKMKMMFQTLVACSNQLRVAMDKIQQKNEPVDIKDALACFTMDIIGSCAFGLECNSFEDPSNDFIRYGKKVFAPVTKLQALRNIFAFSNPKVARLLDISLTNPDVVKFFMDVVQETVNYRENNNFTRKDFMQILIDMKNDIKSNDEEDNEFKHDGRSLTIKEVAAQAFVFFIAGFETSSTTMSFCLFELATNQEIQQKVRREVNKVLEKYQGKITYDSIMEMKYLGQVIEETLRKYPAGALIPRICVEDYKIPESGVIIKKGTSVMIPVLALHHDPEFYPSPDRFDPERFSDEQKQQRRPFTYIPFGEGPRICIGLRFGLMQIKVGLVSLVKNFKFSVNQKTQLPLEMNPFAFLLTPKGGIWLDVEKI